MNCGLIISILVLLIIGILQNAYGHSAYKWISLKPGEELPENKVFIKRSGNRYLGRARHFDEILPAEITTNGSAFISSCHKEQSKEQFEILTLSEPCEWKPYTKISDIDETAVRVGTASNGEPIYVGASFDTDYSDNYHITSIYLTKNNPYTWIENQKHNYYNGPQWKYLSCYIKTKWIDTSSWKVPNNTVSAGKTEDGFDIYVAQLKQDCDIVTGQVIPAIGSATAYLNNGSAIEAAYCEVLIGKPNEYNWVSASDGEIPDYAVVNGKFGNELAYVARINNTVGHLTHSEAIRDGPMDYEILVSNPL